MGVFVRGFWVSMENIVGGVLDRRFATDEFEAAEVAIEMIKETYLLGDGDIIRVVEGESERT
jgi:hypothetical protein